MPRERSAIFGLGVTLLCRIASAVLLVAAMVVLVVVEDKSIGVLAAIMAVITVRFLVLDVAERMQPEQQRNRDRPGPTDGDAGPGDA